MSDTGEQTGSARANDLAGRVVVEYCPRCGWLLRATWLAQELLTTFSQELFEVVLRPSSSGTFRVSVNGALVWDRRRDGGFPQAAELKRLVRDQIAPTKNLGHGENLR